jgi:hypothetical protein
MVSFAFKYVLSIPISISSCQRRKGSNMLIFLSTMIGQVTPIGMANSGWRFYLLFVVRTQKIPLLSSLSLLAFGPFSSI